MNSSHATCNSHSSPPPPSSLLWIPIEYISINMISFVVYVNRIMHGISVEFSPRELRKFASIFLCINKRQEGQGEGEREGSATESWMGMFSGAIIELINHMPASITAPPRPQTTRVVTSKMLQTSLWLLLLWWNVEWNACGRGSYLRRNVITSHLKYPIFYWNAKFA